MLPLEYRARYYDPSRGYINEDPSNIGGGQYLYVGNSPVDLTDRKTGTDGTDPNFFSQSGNGEAIITSVSAGACTAFDMFSLWLASRAWSWWMFPIMLRSAAMPDKSFSLPMPIV
jgi:hypothetical protein